MIDYEKPIETEQGVICEFASKMQMAPQGFPFLVSIPVNRSVGKPMHRPVFFNLVGECPSKQYRIKNVTEQEVKKDASAEPEEE